MSHDEIRRRVADPVSEELSKDLIQKRDEWKAGAALGEQKAPRSCINEKCAMHAIAKFGPIEDYFKVPPPLCPTSILSVDFLLKCFVHLGTPGADGKDLLIHGLLALYASRAGSLFPSGLHVRMRGL